MASKAELKRAIKDARESKNAASTALRKLADLKAPKGAKKALVNLRKQLREVHKRMAKRIPILRKRLEAKRKGGAEKAIKWAKAQIGRTESPAGSNTGPFPVSACQEFTIGYAGVPWCGCFTCYAAVHEGGAKTSSKSRWAYVPYIVADANSRSNGFTAVSQSECRAGDLICFNFDGGVADHVELAIGPIRGGLTDCVGGNTSAGTSGSQDNGGGVFRRQRPVSQIACIARPDY